MKGYAYLDVDGNLYCKSYEYISTENPHFWKDNEGLVLMKWLFDTEEHGSMRAMFYQLRTLLQQQVIKKHQIDAFLAGIDFDVSTLKSNANKVQSGQDQNPFHS